LDFECPNRAVIESDETDSRIGDVALVGSSDCGFDDHSNFRMLKFRSQFSATHGEIYSIRGSTVGAPGGQVIATASIKIDYVYPLHPKVFFSCSNYL
jgi:hypothetical protein